MKKLRELWGKNKVLIVLGMILMICFIAIMVVTISFFFGGSKSVYGNRLDKQEDYQVTDTIKGDVVTSLEDNKDVEKASMDVKGRIIYITIKFNGDVPLDNAKSIATSSLSKIGDELLSYYDVNYTLSSEDTENSEGYVILGAKNSAGSGLVWNNNTPVESEEEK